MTPPATSVFIPSFRRAAALRECLKSLGRQTERPTEVLVVWQGDDDVTRDTALRIGDDTDLPIRVLHSPEVGVVPAENVALDTAAGEIILLIDDDAVAPPDWVECHLAHYADDRIGAVGGPAINHRPDGSPFPSRSAEPLGRLTWYGKTIGNMYDHPAEWRRRPPIEVDHLVGYNLSLRRSAFDRFEDGLQPYWQLFELDACLQVRRGGYRVRFDFANVVEHHPTNPAYAGGRDGDLQIKIYNAAYNSAFVLAKHSPALLRLVRLKYLLAVGSVGRPGLLASGVAAMRFGHPGRELRILLRTWRHHLKGWRDGAHRRNR